MMIKIVKGICKKGWKTGAVSLLLAAAVIFTSFGNTKEDAEKDTEAGEIMQEEEAEMFSTEGKSFSVCGDSISTFTGYIPEYYSKFYPENGEITDVKDTWRMQTAERTGMELCRNAI